MSDIHYVYVYTNPYTKEPIYVGKGVRNRAFKHANRAGRSSSNNIQLQRFIVARRREGVETPVKIVAKYDSHEEAIAHEIQLIAEYGRRDRGLGPLFNATDGGDGAVNLSAEARARIADRMRKMHADPEFAARRNEWLKRSNADPKVLAAATARMLSYHADPKFAEARDRRITELNKDPKFVAAKNAGLKKLHTNPAFASGRNQRFSELNERRRARFSDPEFIARSLARKRARRLELRAIRKKKERSRVENAGRT